MSRQDKATTERFTKTLRELVKRPENKVCADCKRNDPRWASWNLGVFLCIRCSGIHRGMGTHISKVKSVDLDVWTPEQMESIQKWGNYRANLYWEAHLKAGHIPPDHKMESFVRSKYESRRWAMDGQPPTDPSVLENGASIPPPPPQVPPAISSTSRPTHSPSNSLAGRQIAPPVTTRQPQAHQLLSAGHMNQPGRGASAPRPPQAQTPPPQPLKAPENDLFTLDFHAPAPALHSSGSAPSSASQPKKDVKQDILSLFSTPAAASPPVSATSAFGGQFGGAPQKSPWDQFGGGQQQAQQAQATSMMGQNGTGVWGASSGWNGAAAISPPAQGNLWGNSTPAGFAPQQQQPHTAMFANTTDVWGAPAPGGSTGAAGGDLFTSPFASTAPVQKKDDVFGDLWGGFK